jgi:NADPH:quinone reductase-like Zn-dependent oxidoreductase
MRAIQMMGASRELKLCSVNKPKLNSSTNIIVKVLYAPINPSDIGYIFNIYGRNQHLKTSYPKYLGFEGSGVIEESNDRNLLGKRVIFWTNYEKEE